MTRFDVAVLALRILALFLVLTPGTHIVNLLLLLTWGEGVALIVGSLVALLVQVAIGWLVFTKAPAIARRVYPGSEPISSANRPEIGALALMVCGILLFVDGLSALISQVSFGAVSPATSTSVAFALRIALAALTSLVGVVVFAIAPRLALRMFGAPVQPMASSLLAHGQAVTFSVVGLWLLVTALPRLVESPSDWAGLTRAVLGLLLFLGGSGLSAFWHWVQQARPGVRTEPRR